MQKWFENKNVALVGGAQSLFDRMHGNEIDSHEVVCRINRSVLIKDAAAQGNKTDIWSIGVPNTVEDLFPTVKIKNFHLSHKRRVYNGKNESHPNIDFYMPMKVLDNLRGDLGHEKPSSGLMSLYYILYCSPKSIKMYGFDWKETPTWYYEETIYQPHNWLLEKTYIEKILLNRYKNITVIK
jgi:hypothetical protein